LQQRRWKLIRAHLSTLDHQQFQLQRPAIPRTAGRWLLCFGSAQKLIFTAA
jgi:hypothetical protein